MRGRGNGDGGRRDGGRRGGGRGRNNNGNRGGGRGGRRGGGRRGGGHKRNRGGRESSISGNKRERIAVESGALVLIDQYMLANPQFVSRIDAVMDEPVEVKDEIVRDYGGTVVEVEPGTYRIERDPFECSIVVYNEGADGNSGEFITKAETEFGEVLVDTRCLAMIDRELLDDNGLLEKYQQLWTSGQDKACRDLLRDNGGAVRYGFDRFGDELGVWGVPDEDVICLWPSHKQAPAAASAEDGADSAAAEG